MAKVFLPIDSRSSLSHLFGWLDLLHTLEPLRLTAIVAPGVEDEAAACRSSCRKLERFCLERDIRLKIASEPAAPEQSRPDLVLLNADPGVPGTVRPAAMNPHPTLLLPEGAALPAELILLYDGTEASKTAIRQFAELFPSLTELPANLLYIQDAAGSPIPDEAAIRALGAGLYHRFRLISVHGRSTGFFKAWLEMMTNPWIVMAKTLADAGLHAAPQRPRLAADLIRIRPMPAFAA